MTSLAPLLTTVLGLLVFNATYHSGESFWIQLKHHSWMCTRWNNIPKGSGSNPGNLGTLSCLVFADMIKLRFTKGQTISIIWVGLNTIIRVLFGQQAVIPWDFTQALTQELTTWNYLGRDFIIPTLKTKETNNPLKRPRTDFPWQPLAKHHPVTFLTLVK